MCVCVCAFFLSITKKSSLLTTSISTGLCVLQEASMRPALEFHKVMQGVMDMSGGVTIVKIDFLYVK